MPGAPDFAALTAWLATRQRPLLLTHRRPDGDALGALAGMALALRALGQTPAVALYEPLPPRYAPLLGGTPWRRWDQERMTLSADCDAVVILDTCARQQLEPVAEWLADAPPTAIVDHHATTDEIGRRAGDLRVIDPTAGAACLLIHEWVQHVQIPLASELATALYVGLATDTGWFRFSNTDARMLHAAAALVAAGVAPDRLYNALYQQEPAAKLRLIGRMLERLELHANGQLAVLTLRQADFDAAGADRTMTEDLVNEAGRIAELEATVLCSEEPDGAVRVNFRSRTRLDVAALAARFGGGGHARAAGARLPGPWEVALQRVVAETRAALQRGT